MQKREKHLVVKIGLVKFRPLLLVVFCLIEQVESVEQPVVVVVV